MLFFFGLIVLSATGCSLHHGKTEGQGKGKGGTGDPLFGEAGSPAAPVAEDSIHQPAGRSVGGSGNGKSGVGHGPALPSAAYTNAALASGDQEPWPPSLSDLYIGQRPKKRTAAPTGSGSQPEPPPDVPHTPSHPEPTVSPPAGVILRPPTTE